MKRRANSGSTADGRWQILPWFDAEDHYQCVHATWDDEEDFVQHLVIEHNLDLANNGYRYGERGKA